MKRVSILIPNGQFSMVNIAGAFQILETANEIFAREHKKRLFELELVAAQDPAPDLNGLYIIHPAKTIHQVNRTDLIIVPAVHADIARVVDANREAIKWLRDQYKAGSEVASFCIGIFLLAEAGILNGKVCSTHWAHVHHLKAKFPHLNVHAEKFITDNGGVYTSGGGYAFTNLTLYLIEKFSGRALAVKISKLFMIDIDKGSQSTFMMFRGQKNHHDQIVLQIQDFIETHYDNRFSVDELAAKHALIRRTLERRFRKATGNSINEYTQRVRVEAAKKEFENGRRTVNEVMYQVGYNDGKAFRDVFRKYVGLTPLEYRDRFDNRSIEMSRS